MANYLNATTINSPSVNFKYLDIYKSSTTTNGYLDIWGPYSTSVGNGGGQPLLRFTYSGFAGMYGSTTNSNNSSPSVGTLSLYIGYYNSVYFCPPNSSNLGSTYISNYNFYQNNYKILSVGNYNSNYIGCNSLSLDSITTSYYLLGASERGYGKKTIGIYSAYINRSQRLIWKGKPLFTDLVLTVANLSHAIDFNNQNYINYIGQNTDTQYALKSWYFSGYLHYSTSDPFHPGWYLTSTHSNSGANDPVQFTSQSLYFSVPGILTIMGWRYNDNNARHYFDNHIY